MKFDDITLDLLKNFSKINPSILFKPGNELETFSGPVYAKAVCPAKFEMKFGVYDLSRFINTLSLFENPEIINHDTHLTIENESGRVVYTYVDEKMIRVPPEGKKIVLSNPIVQFNITEANFSMLIKALSTLGLSEIAVVAEKGKLFVKAVDAKGKISDSFTHCVGESDNNFTAIFKAEYINNLYPANYFVEISSKGMGHFKSELVEYWIALEDGSKF